MIQGMGERLRELRKSKNMSIGQVAKLCGCSPRLMCAYELGSSEPRASMIIKLATFYKVTSDYLLGLSNIISLDDSNLNIEKRNKLIFLERLIIDYLERNQL